MYIVAFRLPDGRDIKLTAQAGESILALAQSAGIEIDAPCSGNGTCGKCRLQVIAGTVDYEKNTRLSAQDQADGWVLACRSTVCSDVTLLVPAEAGAYSSGIRTADLDSPEELATYEKATGAIFASGLSRGCTETGYGVAVDIGTTTVAAAMLELSTGKIVARASAGNGQIRFGADVINRIIRQGQPGGVERLRAAVCEETLVPLLERMYETSGRKAEEVTRIVIAGNTTMEHLFVGEDAESIRLEPYEPKFLELHGMTASQLKIPAAPDAKVIFAPNVGSYVGGDITAGVLSSMMWDTEKMTLFVDLGTNGELVLGNSDWLMCCACSAGPAFEGGDISCGMRATVGAVQAITLDKETLEPTMDIIGGGKPAGLCGSGIIDLVYELYATGAISPKGRFARDGKRIVRDEYGNAAYILAFAEESATGRELRLDEADIDNFIRAKAAVFSAIRAMLGAVDLPVECLEQVVIAGGIGSGISIEKAIAIGMLPKLDLELYGYIGNSSLTGACAMLLSDEAEEKVYEFGRSMTYIELSTHPGYMDEFVAACFIPHTDASLFE